MYVRTYVRTYVCMCVCMYVYMCVYVYVCMCVYIYIYTHTHTCIHIHLIPTSAPPFSRSTRSLEPNFQAIKVNAISLLTLSLLTLLGSNSPGSSPMDMRIPHLRIKIMLESNPLKPTILVRRLAVNMPLLRLQSSEENFTMSCDIEPVRRSFCRHGSCTFTEVARLVPSGYYPLE